MPIDYSEDFECMFDNNEHGTEVIYTSVSGPVSKINVIMDSGVVRVGFDSEISSTHDECTFLNSDICNPKRGDTIAYGSTTHEFVSVIEDDGVISSWLVKDG